MHSLSDLHAKLSASLYADDLGTPDRARRSRAHRLLTDLVARRGGTPAEREYVRAELANIEAE